jgi:hypothetical protein
MNPFRDVGSAMPSIRPISCERNAGFGEAEDFTENPLTPAAKHKASAHKHNKRWQLNILEQSFG